MAHEHLEQEQHDHEYMHQHNIPHEHTHEHSNDPVHCDGDCHSCDGDPKVELIALLQYMVNHNAAHTNELVDLANQLKNLGENMAFEQVMAAVSDFEKGNMRLSAVLAALRN